MRTKLCANVSLLFTEVPLLERFAAASRAGFTGVEIYYPYGVDPAELASRLREHNLRLVLINSPKGAAERGDHGLACLPRRQTEFTEALDRSREYARALGGLNVHILAGIPSPGDCPARVYRTFVDNLSEAASRLAGVGARALIEPLSRQTVPGYYLTDFEVAARIIEDAAVPNLALQFDLYHAHLMGLELPTVFLRHLPRIAHVQIADAPGRHEPGTGEIDVPAFLGLLEGSGYAGWVGCEYRPQTRTLPSLRWARSFLEPSADPTH